MSEKRVIRKFYVNPKRDKQYDTALKAHLRATWDRPGRTYNQIAREIELGDPNDKSYVYAIRDALTEFAECDDSTIFWYPNLRLSESVLAKKLAKSKHDCFDLKLWKHSPWRKVIDRDPSQAGRMVGKLIRWLLEQKGPQNAHAIQRKMKVALGHVSKEVVTRTLKDMEAWGELRREPAAGKLKNAAPYRLTRDGVERPAESGSEEP